MDGDSDGDRGQVYLCKVRKQSLTCAASQHVPVAPGRKLLTLFFKHLWRRRDQKHSRQRQPFAPDDKRQEEEGGEKKKDFPPFFLDVFFCSCTFLTLSFRLGHKHHLRTQHFATARTNRHTRTHIFNKLYNREYADVYTQREHDCCT